MSLGSSGPGRRVCITAFGETPLEAIQHHLVIEAQPVPEPLGPRDVLVAVKSAAVGWVDLLMSSGQYQHMASPPYVPGLEYAGDVLAVGPEVTRWKPGDQVIADGFRTGPRSLGAYQKWGGFATYALAPDDALFALPTALSPDQGAVLLGAFETAYHCLVARGRLLEGESVLILGATGATGLAAVQLAKLLGARVIAAGRPSEKLQKLPSYGADQVVVATEADGTPRRFRDEVKALTGGRGVDVVYDCVGGALSVEAMHSARFGARFLIVGWAATPLVAEGGGRRGAPNVNLLPTNLIMMKGLDVLGSPAAISILHQPQLRRERLKAILGWVEAGRLSPVVSASFPLEQVVEALTYKWESRALGGCTLHP